MKKWQSSVISPEQTLEQSIALLEKASLRIVLVSDKSKGLIGTLTDGDVRRALLQHLPLSTPVTEVMNTQPKAAGEGWTRDQILSAMEHHQLLHMPIVDQQNQLVGLETLQSLIHRKKIDNPVFLMAGGFGTRLRPLTQSCPKPLLKVGGTPILELILQGFIESGFHRFFISTHYMSEMIQGYFSDGSRWGVSITYVNEDEPLGTAGALGLLPHDEIDKPLFVMNGDLLTSLNFQHLLAFHEENQATATMCVCEHEYQVPFGVIENDGDQIVSITEKPTQRFFINAGIYLLSPELVKSVEKGKRVDMPTLLSQSIQDQKIVNMFPIHEYWLDIGRIEDFNRAQEEYLQV